MFSCVTDSVLRDNLKVNIVHSFVHSFIHSLYFIKIADKALLSIQKSN